MYQGHSHVHALKRIKNNVKQSLRKTLKNNKINRDLYLKLLYF